MSETPTPVEPAAKHAPNTLGIATAILLAAGIVAHIAANNIAHGGNPFISGSNTAALIAAAPIASLGWTLIQAALLAGIAYLAVREVRRP